MIQNQNMTTLKIFLAIKALFGQLHRLKHRQASLVYSILTKKNQKETFQFWLKVMGQPFGENAIWHRQNETFYKRSLRYFSDF